MPNNLSVNRGYELPHQGNNAKADALRIMNALNAVDGDVHALLLDVATRATIAYVDGALAALIGGAPGALDTLNELAAALADDASYAASVTTALSGKAALAHGHAIADISDLFLASHAEAVGGVENTHYMSALRVSQAIAALTTSIDQVARDNIALNFFHDAVNNGLSVLNMIDGFVDEYEDETGVDTAKSSGQTYDATNYNNPGAPVLVTAGEGTETGDGPNGGGVAAHSDGDTAKTRDEGSYTGNQATSWAGKDWGASNEKTIAQAKVYGPSSHGLHETDTTVRLRVQESATGAWAGEETDIADTGTIDTSALSYINTIACSGGTNVRYHRVYLTEGSGSVVTSWAEVEWFTPGVSADITLVSEAVTATASPNDAHVVLFEEDVDAVTLNNDLKAWTTREAGRAFTTDFATDDKLDITAHGLSNDDRILVFSATTLPAGLATGKLYYVINAATNDFELSLTSGGVAVDITDGGTGTHTAILWEQATLTDQGDYGTGKQILTGTTTFSAAMPSGTSMRYLIETLNAKEVKFHGAAEEWR